MATGTAQTAVVGKTYQVGGDDWWRLADEKFILTTDQVVVIGKDDTHVYINVSRDGELLGMQRVALCFFDEDFELVQLCEHTESPYSETGNSPTGSPYTTWAK